MPIAGWGLYEQAESYFKELEHDYRQLGVEEYLVDIHSQQGLLYIDTEEYDKALPLMARSGALLSGIKARKGSWPGAG